MIERFKEHKNRACVFPRDLGTTDTFLTAGCEEPCCKTLKCRRQNRRKSLKNGESTLNPIPFFASTVRSHRFTIVGESVGAYLDVQCVKKLVSDLGGRYSKKSGLF